jgi:hypothetical protein
MRPRPENRAAQALAAAVNSLFPRVEFSFRGAVREPAPRDIGGRETMNNNKEQWISTNPRSFAPSRSRARRTTPSAHVLRMPNHIRFV